MKKTLVAIAALSALSAFAQSSVTMYGSLDAGVFNTKASGVTVTALTSGAHTSSRLGFKGTEDLGGGMKANFGMEAGLSVDTGSMGGPSGANGSTAIAATTNANSARVGNASNQLFSRGAFVGLSGGFGTINAGKISTFANTHILNNTPGANNIAAVSFRSATTGLTGWNDNTIEYVTPKMSGVTARVLHITGNTGATSTANEGLTEATKKYGSGQEFGLTYANGPLTASAYSATRKLATSATAEEKSSGVGATYDFGVAKVGFSNTSYDPTDAAVNDKKSGTAFAVTYPVNAKVTLMGFHGVAKVKTATETKATFNSVNLDYAFSKRTTAYVNYTTVSNDGAKVSLAGMGSGNAAVVPTIAANGDKASAMGVGIRHSF